MRISTQNNEEPNILYINRRGYVRSSGIDVLRQPSTYPRSLARNILS